jgi:Ca2+-binding RTX toxin-like protein
VEDFALDLSVFEEGGLYFRNMLTGEAANLGDSLAPLVTDEEGIALPIQTFHALGGEDGFNFLNPAAGAQASELDLDCFGLDEDDDGAAVVGFEDLRVTQQGFDGDYNDFLVLVSDEPAEDLLDFDDLIVGSDHRDHLRGGRDDEILLGFDGNDRLRGGRGDDLLCGDEGKDRLNGGRGDDTLLGGNGDDVLVGGRGEDVFSVGLDEGDDTIRDFKVGVDSIDLSETALSFDDLTIGAAKCGTQIELGTGSILLVGVNVAEVDETSFVF